MSTWALIVSGVVHEVTAVDPAGRFAPDMVWRDVSAVSPQPQPGWTFDGTAYHPPAAPPAPTLAQQAATAISAGLTITRSSTPALDATYAVNDTTQSHIQAEMIALLVSGNAAFADGTASVAWPDIAGATHAFTIAEFKPFALAVGAYVAALYKVMNGTLTTLPSASVTIA